ncbi:MAG: ABC transporter substrate-binding protein [Tissierellia bacterium]|jgi:D-methionine transport system substrate-binding protein|nr:ABC transporter substrate-binding protein [Tissierellia bacterium]
MKKINKLLLIVLVLTLAVTAFGCTNNEPAPAEENSDETPSEKQELTKITVAASPVPHAEILAQIKADLADKGFELEVIEFAEYVQPNMVVEAGDIDANFFQHKPYLDNFNEERGTNIVSVAAVHFEPLGIYPGKSNDLSNIPDGAEIAVPNDTTNEARALLLLEANGIIRIKEGAGLTATKLDIVENPHNVEIVELEAAQVARVVNETDFVVLNGNYALEAGFNVQNDSLAKEEQESQAAQTYANILCVKKGNEETEKTKALIEALKSDNVKQFIADTYEGGVVAID